MSRESMSMKMMREFSFQRERVWFSHCFGLCYTCYTYTQIYERDIVPCYYYTHTHTAQLALIHSFISRFTWLLPVRPKMFSVFVCLLADGTNTELSLKWYVLFCILYFLHPYGFSLAGGVQTFLRDRQTLNWLSECITRKIEIDFPCCFTFPG